jgi:hypothetical protein
VEKGKETLKEQHSNKKAKGNRKKEACVCVFVDIE